MYALRCMVPIRTALVALPLLILLSLTPRESSAEARESESARRPAAALVAPADPQGRDSDDGLSPFGLAALVGIGLVPALVLVSRRRQQRQPN